MSRPPAWLLAHVHPLVKKLSTELVAILWARLEQQLGDGDQPCEIASR